MKREISDKNIEGLLALIPAEGDKELAERKLISFKKRHTPHHFRSIIWYAAAAVIVLLAGTLVILRFQDKPSVREYLAKNNIISNNDNSIVIHSSPSTREISTGPGEVRTFTLEDGTIVWLNAKSVLRYPKSFNQKERHVELVEGEAFFEVAHNKDLPFVVSSCGYDIKVLGTKFNVFAYNRGDFKTSLVEGSIEIRNTSSMASPIKMKPNESASDVKGELVKGSINSTGELMWKEGLYVFDNAPLSEITSRLELYFGAKIVIEDSDVANHRLSGKFRYLDGPDVALNTLKLAYHFDYEYDSANNRFIITK